MRVGLLWSSINSDSDTNSAAPKATSVLVRRPAGCRRHCRSTPMIKPRARATPALSRNVQLFMGLNRYDRNVVDQTALCYQKPGMDIGQTRETASELRCQNGVRRLA